MFIKKPILQIAIILCFSPLVVGFAGCMPLACLSDFSAQGNCAKLQKAERDALEGQILQELPALQKRADAGDVKAQVAMGQFHVQEYHPGAGSSAVITGGRSSANRALGLAYYHKAAMQGDLNAQRIFAEETIYDCRAKDSKLHKSGDAISRSNRPRCNPTWSDMDLLVKNLCVY